MNSEQKLEITRLALEAHRTSERLRLLGLQAMQPSQTSEEKENRAIEYALARAEMFEADRLLTHAIQSA